MQEDMMEQLEQAREQVAFFAEKFSEWHGAGHLVLARHAAFPVSVTVDLLYQLWANFKAYPDEEGAEQIIPMLAVSDLVLSSLFRQTGRDIYEMQPEVRALLLDQLKRDQRFGELRIQQLASFLSRYIREQPDRPEWKNFKEAQLWTALLATDPGRAAEQILQALVNKVGNTQVSSSIGIANMMEAFAKDNEAFARQVADHLQSNTGGTETQPATADDGAPKKLVLARQAAPLTASLSINLPPYISNRLKRIKTFGSQPVITETEISGTVYGLFAGISKYERSTYTLLSADKNARTLSQCLQENGLIKEENMHLLLNKDATEFSFRSRLKSMFASAGTNDFVIIYFSGGAINRAGASNFLLGGSGGNNVESRLILYDPDPAHELLEPSPSNEISEDDFSSWINQGSPTRPTIVVILDTHSGSRQWLNRSDPRQVLMMASHLTQYAGEGSTGGFFTTALIKAIQESKGRITYKNLYKKVCEYVQQDGALLAAQSPLFITAAWDTYIFKHKQINRVLPVQLLLNEFGYTVKADGIDGPETESAKQHFLQDLGMPYEGDLRFCLERKRIIRQQGKITVLMISAEPLHNRLMAGRGAYWTELHHPVEALFDDSPGSEQSAMQQSKRPENAGFTDKLMSSCSIILFLRLHILQDNRIYQNVERLLDLAFALDKEVLLIWEENRLLGELESRYRSIIRDSIRVDFTKDVDIFIRKVDQYRTFLQNLLTIDRRKKPVLTLEASYTEAVEAARQTGRLDISNLKLPEIPAVVFRLSKLEELSAAFNHFTEIPPDIARLRQLRVLNLNGNPLSSLPPELMELQNLETLSLSNTSLLELPANINRLQSLRELYVHSTRLSVLPDALADISKLTLLDARENHILNIPPAVLRSKNAPKKFRTYIKTLPPETISKPNIILLSADKSGETIINRRLREINKSCRIDVQTGAVTTDFLYKILRSGTAEYCLVYIKDNLNYKEGKHIFEQFDLQGLQRRPHVVQQYFRDLHPANINIIYDCQSVGDGMCSELTKIPGINAVLVLNTMPDINFQESLPSTPAAYSRESDIFTRLYLERYLEGGSITESCAAVSTGIVYNDNRLSESYVLFKSENFVDFRLPAGKSTGKRATKKIPAKVEASAVHRKKARPLKSARKK